MGLRAGPIRPRHPGLMLTSDLLASLRSVVGADHVLTSAEACADYGVDALGIARGRPAEAVVRPATTAEVAAVVTCCHDAGVPFTPRGAGTGYTGGAVPTAGGIVIALERLDRILEIDTASLLAVVQPHVVTGELQRAVEARGLFYPPDPASLSRSVIGGNVAEGAGGPRAFKYGTTKRYVLGLQAVLPTGQVVRTGGRTVKNVVGYDLTQLLVGSEGTLALITEVVLRLLPSPRPGARSAPSSPRCRRPPRPCRPWSAIGSCPRRWSCSTRPAFARSSPPFPQTSFLREGGRPADHRGRRPGGRRGHRGDARGGGVPRRRARSRWRRRGPTRSGTGSGRSDASCPSSCARRPR